MRNLILLEDEAVLQEELVEFLSDSGYQVDPVASLAEFRRVYEPARHRLAIIDLGLPDGDGMALIRELRAQDSRTGIVVLTARGTTRDKVAGLGGGADYFLPKTSDLDELAATLAALARRLGEPTPAPEPEPRWILELGPRRLLPPGFGPITLSQQDLVVLHILMKHAGAIVSRQQITEALGEDFLGYDQRRLDTQMRRLRRKVDEATGLALAVNTARNAGYRFFAAAEIRP